MKKSNEKQPGGPSPEIAPSLEDLIRQGARQVIQQAIDAELAHLLEQYENVKTFSGHRTVVRNGYLPGREVLTAVGPVTVRVPKVRDRSGSGVKFSSALVPPYVRRSSRVSSWVVSRLVKHPTSTIRFSAETSATSTPAGRSHTPDSTVTLKQVAQ